MKTATSGGLRDVQEPAKGVEGDQPREIGECRGPGSQGKKVFQIGKGHQGLKVSDWSIKVKNGEGEREREKKCTNGQKEI